MNLINAFYESQSDKYRLYIQLLPYSQGLAESGSLMCILFITSLLSVPVISMLLPNCNIMYQLLDICVLRPQWLFRCAGLRVVHGGQWWEDSPRQALLCPAEGVFRRHCWCQKSLCRWLGAYGWVLYPKKLRFFFPIYYICPLWTLGFINIFIKCFRVVDWAHHYEPLWGLFIEYSVGQLHSDEKSNSTRSQS